MSSTKTEYYILRGLLHNKDYSEFVYPFLKEEYFEDEGRKKIFEEISQYKEKYNDLPDLNVLKLEIENRTDLQTELYESITYTLEKIKSSIPVEKEKWLIDKTEEYCKERALDNAILKSISAKEEKYSKIPKSAIPDLISQALSVSFQERICHSYFDDAEERYDYYQRDKDKIPFGLEKLNKITLGGIERKTLNLILGGINVGKSLILCHLASDYIKQGYNVLYISFELAEEKIAERIDANLLDTEINNLCKLEKDYFLNSLNSLKKKTTGKMEIQEYPTKAANSNHIKKLIKDLKRKKGFNVDILMIDYLGICGSSTAPKEAGLYQYGKAVSEELRAIAVELNIAVWSAIQTDRGGNNNLDIDMTNTSESIAIPQTADFIVAVTRDNDLDEQNEYLFIQNKSRYDNPAKERTFNIGVDKPKMKLFDLDDEAGSERPEITESKMVEELQRIEEKQKPMLDRLHSLSGKK